MAKKGTIIEEDGLYYELRSVSAKGDNKPLGKVPVQIPNPTASAEERLEQFIAIVETNLSETIRDYVQGRAVELQRMARSMAEKENPAPPESEINKVANNLDWQKIGDFNKIRAEAIRVWNEENPEETEYNEDYIFRCFM